MERSALWQGLDRLSVIAVLVVAGLVGWRVLVPAGQPTRQATTVPTPEEPVPMGNRAMLGSGTAPVGMIVFSDFECPFCGRFARETWPAVRDKYVTTGRVSVAFWHVPLENIHPLARRAAELADCAGRQGRFWEFHDRMFGVGLPGSAGAPPLSEEVVQAGIRGAGLDNSALDKCASDVAPGDVQSDIAAATKFGVRSTPTFFLGTLSNGTLKVSKVISGAKPLVTFTEDLDSLLGKTK